MAMETTGSLSGIVHSSSEEVPVPLINNPLLQSTYLTIIAGQNTQPLAGATISVQSPRSDTIPLISGIVTLPRSG
ncbi:hypothetical protein ACFL27_05955 [candidate division CSSED10-310 bacterium]|uniref:Uncharacterized protein n=1 Tax=candidate division CSSED10-310 bacterium TaxID=2855610 RepID=A0ABV6YUH8_UNCC1